MTLRIAAGSPDVSLARFRGGALGSFRMEGGVARPADSKTDTLFRAFQRAINAFIGKFALATPRLSVDGLLGPQTLSAYHAVAASAPILGAFLPAFSTVAELANQVETLLPKIARLAGIEPDMTPGTSVPGPPPSSTLPSPSPDGGEGGGGTSGGRIAAAAVLIGAGAWLLFRRNE